MAEDEATARRRSQVTSAVGQWTKSFADLSGKNRLLYFKPSTTGTLDLTAGLGPEPKPEVISRLLDGDRVALHDLFPDRERLQESAKRCHAIARKARELLEERGLAALYLAYGMARWDEKKSEALPAAPVLMFPLRLEAISPVGDDWWLQLERTCELNPSLIQKLESDFGVRLEEDDLVGSEALPTDADATLRDIQSVAAGVAGFEVGPAAVVGTFTYRKLPMVRDLEENLEAAIGHDIVAALAGDEGARAAVRARSTLVDSNAVAQLDPSDEHIVVDADSSQSRAIECVAGGADLVIQGPPGTGKSQTIANLIATLAADGKSVLFVAEKREAVDAVLRRLDAVGLADLVLDLHGKRVTRRFVAGALGRALDGAPAESVDEDHLEELHRTLAARRQVLDEHVAALHTRRSPWGVSVYEAEVGVREGAEAARTSIRIESSVIDRLTVSGLDRGSQLIYELVELERTIDRESPWADFAVAGPAESQAVLDGAIGLLDQELPRVRRAVQVLTDRYGLAPAGGSKMVREYLGALDRLASALRSFRPEALTGPEPTVANLGALGLPGARVRGYEGSWVDRLRAQREWWAEHADVVPTAVDGSVLAEAGAAVDELDEAAGLLLRLAPARRSDLTFDELQVVAESLIESTDDRAALDRQRTVQEGVEALGLAPIARRLIEAGHSPEEAVAAFRHAWWASVRDQLWLRDPSLKAPWATNEVSAKEYLQLDREHVALNALRVRAAVAAHREEVAATYPDEQTQVLREAKKSSRHLAVADLIALAPHVVTALKPCFVASPLDVAALFPGAQPVFDVVVFDEASQVPPADAVPAILRGERLVVAGDRQQLPPTTFFEVASDEENDRTDYWTAGFDSILDVVASFLPSVVLGWHYRSLNQSLIAFSNQTFYGDALTTFPGPAGVAGVELALVPGVGQLAPGEVEHAEVEMVVDRVIGHARRCAERSLGVIAFGIEQAKRIDEALRERLRAERGTDVAAFFDESRAEPFFIKNLERVQGDERDDIILSVGYSSRNADGSLRLSFGPINREGGERRLNVAITRARSSMVVISTFTAADIAEQRINAGGVRVLRDYLAFVEDHHASTHCAITGAELDAFESELAQSLAARGWEVEAKVGSRGDHIDLVLDRVGGSDGPVALETDGPVYASFPAARDRERIRPEHLERLGWRYHRIWLQEWVQDRQSALERIDSGKSSGNPSPHLSADR